MKINALEEDFVNKMESLDSKQRSFEEDVKERLKGTQEKFDSQLKTLSDKLSKALDTAEQQMHVKEESFTPLKASLPPEVSKFSTPLSVSSGDPNRNGRFKNHLRLTANHSGNRTSHSSKSSLE